MNIHSSVIIAVCTISRDGVGDVFGLIIKCSFNCILLHYNDVSELARLSFSLCACVCARMLATPADLETGRQNSSAAFLTTVDKKMKPSLSGLRGPNEVCRDSCEAKIVENMFLILSGVSPS